MALGGEGTCLGSLSKLVAKRRLAFRSVLFIPLFIGCHCPGTEGPRGLAQTSRTGRFCPFQNDAVFPQCACPCESHPCGLWGFQSLIFIHEARLGPILVVSGARAIYERKVPEKQERALGRKKESLSPSKIQTLGGFPGGAVVGNLPASAGDAGSSPGLGGSHVPGSS